MFALSLAQQLSDAVVIGVITGAVYSLVALGIVLVYKASGIFNFAQGEFGTVAVYVTYLATEVADLSVGLAIILALACAVAMGLATERLVIRPLSNAPRVTLLVATAGVALLAIGVEFWRANDPIIRQLTPLSRQLRRIEVLGIAISDQRLIILAVLAAVAAGLVAFFRSPLGLAVLASSQEPVAAELVGVSVNRISSLTWGLAALLGGIAGVLSAPISSFNPGFMTFGGTSALIPGFTAAVLGGMTSLPGAVAGGLGIGIIQGFGGLSGFEGVPGAKSVIVFGVLLLVLLVRPQGLFARSET